MLFETKKRSCLTVLAVVLSLCISYVIFINLFSFNHVEQLSISSFSYFSPSINHDIQNVTYIKTAIIAQVSDRSRDLMVLRTNLYPSWSYVNTISSTTHSISELYKHPQIDIFSRVKNKKYRKYRKSLNAIISNRIRVIVDLLLFCLPQICIEMPFDCQEMSMENSDQNINLIGQCFYIKLDDEYEHRMQVLGYRFLHSLYFLTEQAFTSIVHQNIYDYYLRTDADALIAPMALVWIPKYSYKNNNGTKNSIQSAAFGAGWMSTEFTQQRLKTLAVEYYKFNFSDVQQMQSTWYIEAGYMLDFSKLAINLTIDFFKNQFTSKICDKIHQKKNSSLKCGWPNWHKGVSSLYGTLLAVNHFFYPSVSQEWASDFLDVFPERSKDITTVVHMHNLMKKHLQTRFISRLKDKKKYQEFCNKGNNTSLLRNMFDLKSDIRTAKTSTQYASRIIGHSLKEACRAFIL